MNPAISLQQARQRAQEDVQDIDALSSSQPFKRYWSRRLNDLYHENVATALNAKTADEREAARHRARLLRELADLPAVDRASAEKMLKTPAPSHPMPQQAG